jgi:ketosteroid isomerase-like protein
MRSTDILKTTFDQLMAAFSARDLETVISLTHENVVFLGVLAPVPVAGRDALRSFLRNFFDVHEYVRLTPLDPHFQVTDAIGLVWGSFLMEVQPKRLERKTFYIRFSSTLSQFDTTWRFLSMHTSWMPQEG